MHPIRLAMEFVLASAALVLASAALLSAAGEVNQKAIDDVAAGKLKEARASWWGFDEDDSTAALQAAIDSGAAKLTIDNVGKAWITRPLRLASNQEITIEDGVTVLAKRGEFRGRHESLFNIDGKENVTIRGYGATLRMRRDDYARAPYEKAEWRMALNLRGVKDVKIYGVTLAESGGDGIYVGAGPGGAPCRNVLIKDVVCDSNYRQGISVISAENLLIEDCVLENTDGTAPRAGIDFEPNRPAERLVNCVLRNCVMRGNAGDGIGIYIPTLNASSKPVSLRFENCQAVGDRGSALRIYTGNSEEDAVLGSIEFVGCLFARSRGPGIAVGGKPAAGLKLRFERCTVADVAMEMPAQSPILFFARADARRDIGGVELSKCTIRDPLARRPVGFDDRSGEVRLEGITGELILEREGKSREVRITRDVLAEWMPVLAFKAVPRVKLEGLKLRPARPVAAGAHNAPPARLRHAAAYALYAEEGQRVELRVRHQRVGRYSGSAMPLVITAPSGAEALRAEAPLEEETRVAFAAPETGVYRVDCEPGANCVQITSSTHPISLSSEPRPIPFYATTGRFFFWVPDRAEEFAVRMVGQDGGESLKATLIDPAGKIVQSADNILQVHQFTVELPAASPAAGAVWSLLIERPSAGRMEDYRVSLLGVPPLLAGSADAVLVTAAE
ncbi:MAG: right-handed parallel beta-helix repeat-containing protein [Planctomycetes bacterium]|nr:right-handed parallel beta-helix repeat-containing protein [Planctomycetota bacterium]